MTPVPRKVQDFFLVCLCIASYTVLLTASGLTVGWLEALSLPTAILSSLEIIRRIEGA